MIRRSLATTTGVAATALLVAGLMTGVAHAGTTAAPPWEPDSNSAGSLTFYDSSGNQITGGSLNAAPLAGFVEGSAAIRSGDTKATLYGYLPVDGEAPGQWSGEIIGGPTVYPNASAPGALGTTALPVETGQSIDESLADLAADLPNKHTSSDGYAGLYQLRLRTTQAGAPANTTYDSADIAINTAASTWSVVYPAQTAPTPTATATTLTTTQSSPQVSGTTVQLNAAVTPAAAGSVQFEVGSSDIGSPVAVTLGSGSGTASISTSTLPVGTDSLSAVFTPTSTASFGGSTGTDSFTISPSPAAATSTSLSVDPTTSVADTAVTLAAGVTSGGASLTTGTVSFYDNLSTLLGSAPVGSSGTATLVYSDFAAGAHSITAQFVPANSATYATSTSAAVPYTATAAANAPAALNLSTTIPAGTLTITTPYSPSNPFELGTAVLNPTAGRFTASAPFGSQSDSATGNDGGVTVTDTRPGDLPWTASATVTNFQDGASTPDVINGENLAFTGVTAVQIQGNALLASTVTTTNITSAASNATPYSPADSGSDGLKNGPHVFATTSAGAGEVDIDGVLTLYAPTSTPAGTYTATLTFTIV